MTLAAVITRSKSDREGWKYTSLAPLAAQKFAPPAKQKSAAAKAPLPSIVATAGERHQIVFMNGVWQPELSQLGELEGRSWTFGEMIGREAPGNAAIFCASDSSRSRRRAHSVSFAPAWPSCQASSSPMPDDAPVINTDLLRKNAGAAGMRDMIHHARCGFRPVR